MVPGWTEELPVQPRSSEQRLRGREVASHHLSLPRPPPVAAVLPVLRLDVQSAGDSRPCFAFLRVAHAPSFSLSHPRNLPVSFSPFFTSICSSIGRIGSIIFDPIIGLKSFPFLCSFAIRSSLARWTVLSLPLRVDRQDLDRSLGW